MMMELVKVWIMIKSGLEVGCQSIVLLVGGHRILKPRSGLGADEDLLFRAEAAESRRIY